MKKQLFVAAAIFSAVTSFGQLQENSLKLQQELSFTNGVGLNLATQYISRPDLAADGSYIIVKTNIPFEEDYGMTSLTVNYWGYDKSWETVIGWYISGGQFFRPNAYATGLLEHEHVKLFVENGKVCLALPPNSFSTYGSLNVSKTVGGLGFTAGWEKDWVITDFSTISGTQEVTVPIQSSSNTTISGNFASEDLQFNTTRTHNLNGNQLSFKNGNVGINTDVADRALVVNGEIAFTYDNERISWNGIKRVGTVTTFFNDITGTDSRLIYDFRGKGKSVMQMTQGGTVIVGEPAYRNYQGYKMVVVGKLGAQEIEVRIGGWADYVFKKDYQLMSLFDVEKYIEKEGRLPNVPSAEELKKNGGNIGELTTIQQEKIEELTLYAIQQQKQIELLVNKLSELEQKIK